MIGVDKMWGVGGFKAAIIKTERCEEGVAARTKV